MQGIQIHHKNQRISYSLISNTSDSTNILTQCDILQTQQYNIPYNNNNQSHINNINKTPSDRNINQFEINPLFAIKPFNPLLQNEYPTKKLSLREHVFISKECTRKLSEYVVKEDWGNNNEYGLLYKYLDYIFRCQIFSNQVIQIDNQYLMFHTGLQRRCDSEFLYALLIPNKKYVQQKWRVGFGNIKQSFLSKKEILYKLRYLLQRKRNNNDINYSYKYEINNTNCLLAQILPKRTKFHQSLDEFLFDDSYEIEVNWEERIITNKDRICKVLGIEEFTEKWKLRQLMNLFDKALDKTKKTLSLNPRLAVAQGFVDSKNYTYRMELLLPLHIEYPKFSNKFFTFALAINKSIQQTEIYTAKSILTTNMAYNNARLVSYVESSWLLPPVIKHNKSIIISDDSQSVYANNEYVLC